MVNKKVTIIGAGNGGHALAFDITQNGKEVMLFEHPDFTKNLEGIKQKGGIEAIKELHADNKIIPTALSGFAKITHLTSDPQEAVNFSDVVIMIVPQFAQANMFKLIMPYIKDGQILLIMPGNFGSLLFKKMMRENGINKKIVFIETNTMPYASRVVTSGKVFIMGVKDSFSVASLPAGEMNNVIEKLRDIFSMNITPCENVLKIGFSNPNMIMHVATAVLGMGPMESREGKMQFYAEGASPSVCKVLEKEDEERINVGKAYGLDLTTFVETCNNFYNLKMKSIRDFAANSPIHNNMPNDSPHNPKYRYISEDCPCGLVPVYSFGKSLDVPCPAIKSIITISGIYNDLNYFKTGVTIEKLGLSGMKKEQILAYLN